MTLTISETFAIDNFLPGGSKDSKQFGDLDQVKNGSRDFSSTERATEKIAGRNSSKRNLVDNVEHKDQVKRWWKVQF